MAPPPLALALPRSGADDAGSDHLSDLDDVGWALDDPSPAFDLDHADAVGPAPTASVPPSIDLFPRPKPRGSCLLQGSNLQDSIISGGSLRSGSVVGRAAGARGGRLLPPLAAGSKGTFPLPAGLGLSPGDAVATSSPPPSTQVAAAGSEAATAAATAVGACEVSSSVVLEPQPQPRVSSISSATTDARRLHATPRSFPAPQPLRGGSGDGSFSSAMLAPDVGAVPVVASPRAVGEGVRTLRGRQREHRALVRAYAVAQGGGSAAEFLAVLRGSSDAAAGPVDAPVPPLELLSTQLAEEGRRTLLHGACLALNQAVVECVLGWEQEVLGGMGSPRVAHDRPWAHGETPARPRLATICDGVEQRTPLHCAVAALIDADERVAACGGGVDDGDDDDDVVSGAMMGVVRCLLASAPPEVVLAQDIYGRTPLHLAILAKNVGVCEALLDAVPSVALWLRSTAGDTPLHYATRLSLPRPFVERLLLHMNRAAAADSRAAALPVWRRFKRRLDKTATSLGQSLVSGFNSSVLARRGGDRGGAQGKSGDAPPPAGKDDVKGNARASPREASTTPDPGSAEAEGDDTDAGGMDTATATGTAVDDGVGGRGGRRGDVLQGAGATGAAPQEDLDISSESDEGEAERAAAGDTDNTTGSEAADLVTAVEHALPVPPDSATPAAGVAGTGAGAHVVGTDALQAADVNTTAVEGRAPHVSGHSNEMTPRAGDEGSDIHMETVRNRPAPKVPERVAPRDDDRAHDGPGDPSAHGQEAWDAAVVVEVPSDGDGGNAVDADPSALEVSGDVDGSEADQSQSHIGLSEGVHTAELTDAAATKLLAARGITVGDMNVPAVSVANEAGEPAVAAALGNNLLMTTRDPQVALMVLQGLNDVPKGVVRTATHPPIAAFHFDMKQSDVEEVYGREGSAWMDVLDIMVRNTHVAYPFDAFVTAVGGALVIADEISDYVVLVSWLIKGAWQWFICSALVLFTAQAAVVYLLARMRRSKNYSHAFQYIPDTKYRVCPFVFDAIVFFRATKELKHVTNLTKTKSLEGLTIALAFLEAVTESAPQAALQIAVFRSETRATDKDDRAVTLLYVSIAISLVSILKAVVIYVVFKCSNRANLLGILKPTRPTVEASPHLP